MTAEMDFCLLGPLTVRRRGMVITVPPGSQRVLLAALLLNAGRVVRLDELAELLWGPDVPPSGRVALQNYVMRLRKALQDSGPARIITQPRGYLIRLDAGELDISRFEAHLDAARAAARGREWAVAAAEARAGLGLWRGDPLADVDSEVLAGREVLRLGELRMEAIEIRIDADLHLGQHGDVIAELRRMAAADPLREKLHELLMLALYRDGRQSEALAGYQQARQVLVEELGVEPGPRLRELHRRILNADPALDVTAPAAEAVHRGELAVPRQLPAPVPHFAGRAKELAALTRVLDQNGAQAVVISAIGGTAGVGKPNPGANTPNRYPGPVDPSIVIDPFAQLRA
jgi:DNA-binding SARP family transcriptional activator